MKKFTINKIIIFVIRLYQIYISPFLQPSCRFIPTCSNYAIETIKKDGLIVGVFNTIKRLMSCNPLNKNFGHDPVK